MFLHPRDDEWTQLFERNEFQRHCAEDNARRNPDPILRLLGLIVVGISLLIVFAILGIAYEWQPGRQKELRKVAEPEVPSLEIAGL